MNLLKMKRETVIEEIISSRIETVMQDNFYIHNILEFGCKGISELSDEELKKEYYIEFEEKIEII